MNAIKKGLSVTSGDWISTNRMPSYHSHFEIEKSGAWQSIQFLLFLSVNQSVAICT